MSKHQNLILLLMMHLVAACSPEEPSPAPAVPTEKIKYARGFSITSAPSGKRIDVFDPWQGATGVRYSYYTVSGDEPVPDSLKSETVLRTPVERVVCMSTTHAGFLSALNAEETICGISGAQFVYHKKIKERYERGLVRDVGYGTNLNYELLVQLDPDVVFMYGVGSEAAPVVHKLMDMGIGVLLIAEYLEQTPLAKAEWIRVMGVLLEKEALADSIFHAVAYQYNALAGTVDDRVMKRPVVLTGLPFRDVWYVSPSDTYIAGLIHDAGGSYLWKDLPGSKAVPMSLEQVYLKGREADIWIHTGSAGSLEEITGTDPRLKLMQPVKNRALFNNNKRLSEGAGNDYWESGAVYPQIILRDLVSIFHPELLPDHELFYYKPVPH